MFANRLCKCSATLKLVRFKSYARSVRRPAPPTLQRGRRSNAASAFHPRPIQLDDELYHDRDFDFEDDGEVVVVEKYPNRRDDRRGQQQQRQQFSARNENKPTSFSQRIYELNHEGSDGMIRKVRYNPLFDDDDDYNGDTGDDNRHHAGLKQQQQFDSTRSTKSSKPVWNRKNRNQTWVKGDSNAESSDYESENNKKKKRSTLEWKMSQPKTSLPYDVNIENQHEVLRQVITPFHHLPYGKQLTTKYQHMYGVLQNVAARLAEFKVPYRIRPNGLPCPLEAVKPSPKTEHYRNKDEFSIWPGVDGNSKTVGFLVGKSSRHSKVVCIPPDHISISPPGHIQLAKKFQAYLEQVSPYDSCQNYGVAGHWRRLLVRSNNCNEHMLTAVMHPQDLSDEQLREEMNRLRDFFKDDPLVKSLYFHASRHTRSTKTGEPYYHLAGQETISQQLFDKHFNISPSTFFQVNSAAAEVLYRNVMTEVVGSTVNKGKEKRKTILLDLCCGTGCLATLLARHVGKVIGIDSSATAIEDAKRNAADNRVRNIEFIHGSVEETLPMLAADGVLEGAKVVAVTNPTRQALHPSAIRLLRQLECIDRLVYVSCKADGNASFNFVQLCNPSVRNDLKGGLPFMPTNAIPVDLFPHTSHCELIVTFERL